MTSTAAFPVNEFRYHPFGARSRPVQTFKSTNMKRFNYDNDIRQFIEGTEFDRFDIMNNGAVLAYSSTGSLGNAIQIGWIR